jgi:archaellum component FlaF (FlaF/FlaG flagellin family)
MAETPIAFAIVGFSILVVFGMVYASGWGAFEGFQDAKEEEFAADAERFDTEFSVAQLRWDEGDPVVDGDERLILEVNNTGSATLPASGTDLVIDGRYVPYDSENVTVTVDGTDADVWNPGTTLRIEVDDGFVRSAFDLDLTADAKPDRIRFVTGPGIAVSEPVP